MSCSADRDYPAGPKNSNPSRTAPAPCPLAGTVAPLAQEPAPKSRRTEQRKVRFTITRGSDHSPAPTLAREARTGRVSSAWLLVGSTSRRIRRSHTRSRSVYYACGTCAETFWRW